MSRTTRLAIALTDTDPPLPEQLAQAARAGADLVELRVDAIGEVDAVADLLATPHDVPIILTIRSAEEGGEWDGDDAERVSLYERLGLLLPGYVDVELATWQRSANLRQKIGLVCDRADAQDTAAAADRRKNRLILSQHDFRGTPKALEAVMAPLLAAPAAVAKAAFLTHSALDAWRLLAGLRAWSQRRPTIALGMGAAGLLTRALAGKYGGYLAFAALAPDKAAAPGQPTARELVQRYRFHDVAQKTTVYGLIGWPVGHSRSPHVHNAAMAAAGIDGVYVPMPTPSNYADFAQLLDFLTERPALDVRGLSVTLPHKAHALHWLDGRGFRISDVARAAGSVNTLTWSDGGWIGDNTDVSGVQAALESVSGEAPGDALVLGAGGVARAAVVALRERGWRMTVTNRTAARAAAFAEEFGCAARPWAERADQRFDLLVNCTRVGMAPDVDDSPFPAEALRAGGVVFDTVYAPERTRLLREASERGARTISGVDMFLAQAAGQFERWHGRRPGAGVMRAALDQADEDEAID